MITYTIYSIFSVRTVRWTTIFSTYLEILKVYEEEYWLERYFNLIFYLDTKKRTLKMINDKG